jgi:hypothetical protein
VGLNSLKSLNLTNVNPNKKNKNKNKKNNKVKSKPLELRLRVKNTTTTIRTIHINVGHWPFVFSSLQLDCKSFGIVVLELCCLVCNLRHAIYSLYIV